MITLVFERHEPKNVSESFRTQLAIRSFSLVLDDVESKTIPIWAPYSRSSLDIGDRRELPYLKDMLREGLMQCEEGWVVFSNSDIILLPSIVDEINKVETAKTLRRMDVGQQKPVRHIGRDVFVFNRDWLLNNIKSIPDFLIGAERFDIWLAAWIRIVNKGIKSTVKSLFQDIEGCEIPEGHALHIVHESPWNAAGYCDDSPANIHNRTLFKAHQVMML